MANRNEPIEPPSRSLRDYGRLLLRRKWYVLIGVVACAGPAAALSLTTKPVYQADAQMLLQPKSGEAVFGTGVVTDNHPDRTAQNEISVLQGDVVYAQVRKDLGLVDDFPHVAGTGNVSATDVITVSVKSGDPTTAATLANAYVQAYKEIKRSQSLDGLAAGGSELTAKMSSLQDQIDAIDKQIAAGVTDDQKTVLNTQRTNLANQQSVFRQRLDQLQVDSALISGGADLVAPAKVPTSPVEPKPIRTTALGFIVGLLLGLGAAFLVDYLDDSINSPEDLTKTGAGLSLLSVVPAKPMPDGKPLALSTPDDPTVEAYRTLRTSILFLGFERNLQVVMVTSASPGDGKTTTASNLAIVLAQTGANVLLLDADLRRPTIHKAFGLGSGPGLTDNLLGEPLELTMTPVGDHLTIVGAGTVPPNPSEMLSGKRMKAFIDGLRSRFDYIVIDSAPVLPVSDSVALSSLVDGVLVVVQSRKTSAPQLRSVAEQLEQVEAPVLGVVLNRVERKRGGYGYGYSYSYSSQPSANGQATTKKKQKAAAGRK